MSLVPKNPKPSTLSLMLGVFLLFVIWLTRLATLKTFPPFLDEAIHIHLGELSRTSSLIAYAPEGRLFTIWWYMIFQPHLAGGVWLARVSTLLSVLLGVSALMGIGRLAGGRGGLVVMGLLYLISPFHFFFDRLALADTISANAILLALYFAYRLVHRVQRIDAFLSGLAFFAAIGAKVSALPYLGIPLAAVLTLPFQQHTNDSSGSLYDLVKPHKRWLLMALGSSAGLTAIFVLGLRLFGYNVFSLISKHNQQVTDSLLSRTFDNTEITLAAVSVYTGQIAFGLLLASVAVLIIRRRFFLPLVLLAPTLALWVSQRQSIRFYSAPMSILLLCGATLVGDEMRRRGPIFRTIAIGMIMLWGIMQGLSFFQIAATNPSDLHLPAPDYFEYVTSDASGFGLDDLYTQLQRLNINDVIGILSNCQSLRYMALETFPVVCPRVNPNGEDIDALSNLMAESRRAGTYVVLEDNPFMPDEASGRLVFSVESPIGRPRLSVYDLSP